MWRQALRRKRTWFIGVPALIVLGALVVPFVYVQFIQSDPPRPLSFGDAPAAPTTATTAASTVTTLPPTTLVGAATGRPTMAGATATTRRTATTAVPPAAAAPMTDGAWRIGSGSLAGYRVKERLVVQPNEAVGRTDKVTGEIRLRGTTVEAGQWTVDMASVKSDDARRDTNYRRAMATDMYPTSTFVLRSPIMLSAIPPEGVVITVNATGDLTLRGKTRSVTFPLKARLRGSRIEALGTIPVRFSDYGIPNPSNGYATTEDHGELEFLLLFDKAG